MSALLTDCSQLLTTSVCPSSSPLPSLPLLFVHFVLEPTRLPRATRMTADFGSTDWSLVDSTVDTAEDNDCFSSRICSKQFSVQGYGSVSLSSFFDQLSLGLVLCGPNPNNHSCQLRYCILWTPKLCG